MRKFIVATAILLFGVCLLFADGRDFASEVKLNMHSATVKPAVTVHSFVDGDTTHFNVPTTIVDSGVLKARYLAINTPESTGKIEEWGKKASNYTRERLSKATSIIIESDNGRWNLDSTGGRYLVWVWYRTSENEDYRNLNIELLQTASYTPTHVDATHLDSFYTTFDKVKDRKFDGMIITGAPLERVDYEDVAYWDELCTIMKWGEKHVHCTYYLCWGY